MTTPQHGWLLPYRDALTRLAERPFALFALLLALHCLALPYRGLAHDAQLYSLQVANQLEPGAYANDLFLKYGSQDQFSLFSRLVAPLAKLLGLPAAFFLVYLVSKALYLFALQRLTLTLIDDRSLAVVALIALAVSPLVFGGWQIFHVAEAFLTPRPLACACTLLGLERLLNRRPVQALGLFGLGMLFHPLMAVGGLAFLALLWLPGRISSALVLVGTLAAGVVVAVPPLAGRLFGTMDAPWLEVTRAATIYNFPLEWQGADWVRTLGALTIVIGASWLPGLRPEVVRFYRLLGVLALGGLVATTIAGEQGYALLFQVQPYRLLWLVQVLQIPLGLALASHLWQTGSERNRLLALVLLGFLGLNSFIFKELVLVACLLPICMLVQRGLARLPHRADWLSHSLALSLLWGLFGWAVFKCGLTLFFLPQLHTELDGLNLLHGFMAPFGIVVWLMITLPLLRRLHAHHSLERPCVWGSLGAVAVVVLATLLIPTTSFYCHHLRPYHNDARFVATTIQGQPRADGARPTVYWGLGQPEIVWMEVGTSTYFERSQLAGSMFQRQTALEGHRRADRVYAFEVERATSRSALSSEFDRRRLERLYQRPLDPHVPTAAEFELLCADTTVDFVVLPHDYGGALANNGRWFVYDCRELRAHRSPAQLAARTESTSTAK